MYSHRIHSFAVVYDGYYTGDPEMWTVVFYGAGGNEVESSSGHTDYAEAVEYAKEYMAYINNNNLAEFDIYDGNDLVRSIRVEADGYFQYDYDRVTKKPSRIWHPYPSNLMAFAAARQVV